MLVVCALAGLGLGILLNWAVDYLPRYAVHVPAHIASPRFEFSLEHGLAGWIRHTRVTPAIWMRAAVELGSILLAVYLGARFGASSELLLYAGGFYFLILVAFIDLKYRLVLNVMIFPAIGLSLVARGLMPGTQWLAVLLGGFFGWMIFAGVAFLRPGELGSGDVKLATLIGLGLGFPNVIWGLLIGVLAGGVAAVILIKQPGQNRKSEMPYAPFLALGAIFALLYNPLGFLW